MFAIDPTPSYFAPAQFSLLGADGELLENKFDVQFKRFTKAQIEVIQTRVRSKKLNDAAILGEVCLGWRVKNGEQALTIPFSAQTLEDTEDKFPGFLAATVRAWYFSLEPNAAANFAAKN